MSGSCGSVVRAFGSHPKGPWFDPRHDHHAKRNTSLNLPYFRLSDTLIIIPESLIFNP